MARGTTFVITGDKALNRKLRRLAGPDAKAIIRKASRAALKPLARDVKAAAPRDSGALARSVTVRAQRRSRRRVGARITTRQGLFQGDTFYGGFQEWGWKTGRRGSSGRTQVEGTRFIRKTVDAKRSSILRLYRSEIATRIKALAIGLKF